MRTELVLLGPAGAPMPVAGRAGISAALVVDERVFFHDGAVTVTAVAVTHGRAVPALGYRFDTADGSVVFSGDTSVNDDLIALARGADILVHHVADLGYLKRHGITGAALERQAWTLPGVTALSAIG
jgi:L-ascorbate metabolism protein UlaG (beta-lactamase superfamily)